MVYLLRQRRDHGWTPLPPTPRTDAPEVLGAYFAQRAAEQEREQEAKQADEHPPAPSLAEILSTSAIPPPPAKAELPLSLANVWQDTLVGLRLRLPREVYDTCVRQAALIICADGVATIGVSDVRLGHSERAYLTALRFALGDALGREVAVRVVLRMPA